ncbi:GNAT family N-acetyltransferase [Halobacillus sp. ACCC02827]|uniref:GNAT family N-acetyltransferase n=1 Tax=Bacillaceae TaxID=186817 RepID=UPI0002A4FBF5|nr:MULTISPECIES: GNAT family N-acetyltransferase [Bacillaceae]ELK48862.1 GNAT family acetyltransferase [Halobacillus sp. BAB-2008]QHT45808.1 GNAT family N-acetyltransferase [Bacillus sp. SB49]WJE16610.1 GNAT family N-acetyltransferase [Halobacillus sp. ACCC02827]
MNSIQVRSFLEHDIDAVQQLNEKENWKVLVDRAEETLCSWLNSEPALVAVSDGEVIGYLRGLTDGTMTLYICELLVKEEYRNNGVAQQLLRTAHECYPETRMEMLATESSASYYTGQGFRNFAGFRKTAEEL